MGWVMVEVFKTTVQKKDESIRMIQEIITCLPGSHVSFDLEDCDKVLRIEGNEIENEKIISLLNTGGYVCEVLP